MSAKTTGIHPLHEVTPATLVGVLSCLISGPLSGWIAVDVVIDSAEFRFSVEAGQVRLEMSTAIAMQLSSLLQRLQYQSCELLPALSAERLVDVGASVTVVNGVVTWRAPLDSSKIHYAVDRDMVNLRLHPVTARTAAASILRGLALDGLRALDITSAQSPN